MNQLKNLLQKIDNTEKCSDMYKNISTLKKFSLINRIRQCD